MQTFIRIYFPSIEFDCSTKCPKPRENSLEYALGHPNQKLWVTTRCKKKTGMCSGEPTLALWFPWFPCPKSCVEIPWMNLQVPYGKQPSDIPRSRRNLAQPRKRTTLLLGRRRREAHDWKRTQLRSPVTRQNCCKWLDFDMYLHIYIIIYIYIWYILFFFYN